MKTNENKNQLAETYSAALLDDSRVANLVAALRDQQNRLTRQIDDLLVLQSSLVARRHAAFHAYLVAEVACEIN